MHPELVAALTEIRAKRAFNAEHWIEKKCAALNEYMRRAGLRACVVSVSGGIDSTVTAALASKASQMQGSPIVEILLLQQPIHSTKSIVDRALLLRSLPNCRMTEIDQTGIFDQLREIVNKAVNIEGKAFADGNLRSYMRTPTAFYTAQLLGQQGKPAIVLGTGNMDEDGYLYYFSKAGDGISDIQLIHDLHKAEVYTVARTLSLEAQLVNAVPSADLWEGQTDEDEIGYSYDAVELWVELLQAQGVEALRQKLSPAAREELDRMGKRLSEIHAKNSHKAKISLSI